MADSSEASGSQQDSKDESNNGKTAPSGKNQGKQHQKVLSWGGAVAGFAADLFSSERSGSSSPNARPPLPPPAPPTRRSSSEEEEYRKRNQRFLQQIQAKPSPNTSAGSGSSKQPFASPSPNTKFRKRLQLKAIEEDDGQSFVVLKPGTGPRERTDTDDMTKGSIYYNQNDPQADDMSSLGGDYMYSSQRCGAGFANNLQGGGGTPPTASAAASRFEHDQEERFRQQKLEMERKLAGALQQNSITKESERNAFIDSYMEQLEQERATLLAQWKSDLQQEEERIRQTNSRHRLASDCYEVCLKPCIDSVTGLLANMEVLLSNMPLTVGAVGLSWVTQGVVWFKFTEEMVESCQHVDYYSDQCSFKEFPGCFKCDLDNPYYQLALKWHYFCSGVAGMACVLFLCKVMLAPQAVIDMLSNPTTSTPIGVFCIAMVCTFAGQYGIMGEIIVLVTSTFHVLLAFWFFYMAFIKFRLMPDPGWFPNVVGISYAGVKTWIYFPDTGLVIMMLCTTFFLGTFFISVARVAMNHKIAAPVCWIQLSAPSITLYAMTLVSQPTPHAELQHQSSQQAKESFREFLAHYYLPSQHIFMALTMVGLVSAVHSLYVRWPTFKTKPFSPAHVAFCFPTLSHTNAIQAYRASVISLSTMPPGNLFKKVLFGYWCLFLVSGTILNIVFTIKYVLRIPEWTKPNVSGEEEPPAHSNTILHEMMDETGAHETMRQPFVSPAVLEASEAGVLVRVKRGTEDYRRHGPFRRTRNVTSLGFDLMLSELELREERARLLDWVAKNAPRKRNRTMSVPGVMHLRNKNDGRDVYGTFSDLSQADTVRQGHGRSKTTIGTSLV